MYNSSIIKHLDLFDIWDNSIMVFEIINTNHRQQVQSFGFWTIKECFIAHWWLKLNQKFTFDMTFEYWIVVL